LIRPVLGSNGSSDSSSPSETAALPAALSLSQKRASAAVDRSVRNRRNLDAGKYNYCAVEISLGEN
jgi:hypothetical protein